MGRPTPIPIQMQWSPSGEPELESCSLKPQKPQGFVTTLHGNLLDVSNNSLQESSWSLDLIKKSQSLGKPSPFAFSNFSQSIPNYNQLSLQDLAGEEGYIWTSEKKTQEGDIFAQLKVSVAFRQPFHIVVGNNLSAPQPAESPKALAKGVLRVRAK